MATNVDGKKIGALTAASSVSASDQIILETSAGTRKVRADTLAAAFAAEEEAPQGTIGFNAKATRHAHNIVVGPNGNVHGYIYAYFGSNMTATVVDTAKALLSGYTSTDNPKLYLVDLMTIPGNLFDIDTTEYKVVGTCATSRTMDDSNWLPSYGPAFAGYDGSNTSLYGWKGTSATVKKLNNVGNIEYIPE